MMATQKANAVRGGDPVRRWVWGGLAVLLILPWLLGRVLDLVWRADPRATVTPAVLADIVPCERDLYCWGNRNNLAGNAACRAVIEARAGGRLRWAPGALVPFDHFTWHRRADGSLIYISEHAQILTAAAGWTAARVRCPFDPRTGQVEGAALTLVPL